MIIKFILKYIALPLLLPIVLIQWIGIFLNSISSVIFGILSGILPYGLDGRFLSKPLQLNRLPIAIVVLIIIGQHRYFYFTTHLRRYSHEAY